MLDPERDLAYLRVVSFYGTTETPQAMAWCIADEPEDRGLRRATVPLGQGIDAAQLILQSKAGVRAGVGELAEIFVRSPVSAARLPRSLT